MGILDSLVYGVLLVIFSAQIFFDVGFIDNEHGERNSCERSFAFVNNIVSLYSAHKYFGIFPLIFLYVSFIISIVFLIGVKLVSLVRLMRL